MRERAFKKRIEFFMNGLTDDGAGGIIAGPTISLFKTWASVKTFKVGNGYQSKDTSLGLSNTQSAVIVTLRKREGFQFDSDNMFFKYRHNAYTMHTNPENHDFKDGYIQFIAVRQYKEAYIPSDSDNNNLAVQLNHQL